MKKICLLIMLMIILVGCGSKTSINGEKKNNTYSFKELESDLKDVDDGIEITWKAGELIGAEEGYGYETSNCKFEIYKYDKKSDEYKEAEKNQKISMPSFESSWDAKVKNGYAYFVNEGNCDQFIRYIEKLK